MIVLHSIILIVLHLAVSIIFGSIRRFVLKTLKLDNNNPSPLINFILFGFMPYLLTLGYFKVFDIEFSLIPIIAIQVIFGGGALSIALTGRGRYPSSRINQEKGTVIGIIAFWIAYFII